LRRPRFVRRGQVVAMRGRDVTTITPATPARGVTTV